MARQQTKTTETAAPTGIYLSITADNHADLVRKIEELHAGFCQPAPVTKDDVKNALNAYVGEHSMPAGRELVQKVCGVDVLSLSQIPEDKYAAVVAACKAA